ncbi:MAG: hypothetical protein JWP02_1059, partial [Acidimicrobiales bacterium]|nr:hypothetical protein [Acidimicrobiales bacterium]
MELATAPSASDAEAIAACFIEDGEVKDEGATRQGHAAIKEWWEGPANAFQYTVEVQGVRIEGDNRYLVFTRLTGDFPGGTADTVAKGTRQLNCLRREGVPIRSDRVVLQGARLP